MIVGIACAVLLSAFVQGGDGSEVQRGWLNRSLGAGRGRLSISLGARVWDDRLEVRNLLARGSLDLGRGLRAHVTARRPDGEWSRRPLSMDFDERYLEAFGFRESGGALASLSLRIGRVRYLRFPEPDRLSVFDQVPSVLDLEGGSPTSYRGALLVADIAWKSGANLHASAIEWAFRPHRAGANLIEAYAAYRLPEGAGWSFEVRAGGLATRWKPLGDPARAGVSGYLGARFGEFHAGIMAEKLSGVRPYTGIMVQFRPTKVTRALGAAGFDYARAVRSLAFQVDLLDRPIGTHRTEPPPGWRLVREIGARRIRTYWESSRQRNEYEHRLWSWGEVGGASDYVVLKEEPWRLDLEALVSPHTSPGGDWLRDRQGPAQLAREVVYRFYRRPSSGDAAAGGE